MSNRTTSVRFTLNFPGKTIVGTQASFDMAGKGTGAVYNELIALMAKHPDFGFEVKKTKQPTKTKQTYKGMDIPFIRDFLLATGDTATLKIIDDTIAFAKKEGISAYPHAKHKFFEVYEHFDYAVAKKRVKAYRNRQLDAKVAEYAAKMEAAKNTASTEENEPELPNAA